MKALVYLLMIGTILPACKAQNMTDFGKMTYLGRTYRATGNQSFVCKQMSFLKGKDTVVLNVRLPFNPADSTIADRGIFFDCQLQPGHIYDLQLRSICLSEVPAAYVSYYRTNAVFSNPKDCSSFVEQRQNTAYAYKGLYGKYVDTGYRLYEIIGVSPPDGCHFDH